MTFIIAICLYSFSMSITPGPTNIIMMSAGVNHGFLKTIPFAAGSALGFGALVVATGAGLGSIVANNQLFMTVLGVLGSAFIIYMGYKIAVSSAEVKPSEYKSPSFLYGVVFQWINPKSWIACLAGIGAFNLVGADEKLFIYTFFYTSIGFTCVLVWGYAGSKISRLLNSKRNLRIFNMTMGGGLILVAVYLFYLQMVS
jgi:threonine/homoserine/homoserine lactone efflux protein